MRTSNSPVGWERSRPNPVAAPTQTVGRSAVAASRLRNQAPEVGDAPGDSTKS